MRSTLFDGLRRRWRHADGCGRDWLTALLPTCRCIVIIGCVPFAVGLYHDILHGIRGRFEDLIKIPSSRFKNQATRRCTYLTRTNVPIHDQILMIDSFVTDRTHPSGGLLIDTIPRHRIKALWMYTLRRPTWRSNSHVTQLITRM